MSGKIGMHLGEIINQLSRVDLKQIIQRILRVTVDKMLLLGQTQQKPRIRRQRATRQVHLHADYVATQFSNLLKLLDKTKELRIVIFNIDQALGEGCSELTIGRSLNKLLV